MTNAASSATNRLLPLEPRNVINNPNAQNPAGGVIAPPSSAARPMSARLTAALQANPPPTTRQISARLASLSYSSAETVSAGSQPRARLAGLSSSPAAPVATPNDILLQEVTNLTAECQVFQQQVANRSRNETIGEGLLWNQNQLERIEAVMGSIAVLNTLKGIRDRLQNERQELERAETARQQAVRDEVAQHQAAEAVRIQNTNLVAQQVVDARNAVVEAQAHLAHATDQQAQHETFFIAARVAFDAVAQSNLDARETARAAHKAHLDLVAGGRLLVAIRQEAANVVQAELNRVLADSAALKDLNIAANKLVESAKLAKTTADNILAAAVDKVNDLIPRRRKIYIDEDNPEFEVEKRGAENAAREYIAARENNQKAADTLAASEALEAPIRARLDAANEQLRLATATLGDLEAVTVRLEHAKEEAERAHTQAEEEIAAALLQRNQANSNLDQARQRLEGTRAVLLTAQEALDALNAPVA